MVEALCVTRDAKWFVSKCEFVSTVTMTKIQNRAGGRVPPGKKIFSGKNLADFSQILSRVAPRPASQSFHDPLASRAASCVAPSP